MATQKVTTCFTITFTDEHYERARRYVEDMKKHPKRVYWLGKHGKDDEVLIIEQITHQILSGYYHDDPYMARQHILKMTSDIRLP